jgi:drug/metabolite transporter (DMT)-like permease
MKDQRKAYLFGILTVLLWSTVASAFKISLRYMEPIQLLLYACLSSIAVLALVLMARGSLSQVFACSGRQYLLSLRQGFLNPFLYYLILFKAYDLLPAQVAQPLNYTWALTLALLSIPLLKQKIHPRELVAGVICYLGVVTIASRGQMVSLNAFDPVGIFLALASTIVWSLSWISGTRDERDPAASLLLAFLFGLPFILATCLITSSLAVEDARGLLGAAYVGVFEMGITFVFWLKALKLSENTARVGNLIFVSPFISLVLIHFVVGEEILASTFAGLILIVAGLMVQSSTAA